MIPNHEGRYIMKQNRNIFIAVPAFICLALFSFIVPPDTEGLTVLQI